MCLGLLRALREVSFVGPIKVLLRVVSRKSLTSCGSVGPAERFCMSTSGSVGVAERFYASTVGSIVNSVPLGSDRFPKGPN